MLVRPQRLLLGCKIHHSRLQRSWSVHRNSQRFLRRAVTPSRADSRVHDGSHGIVLGSGAPQAGAVLRERFPPASGMLSLPLFA